MADERPEYEVLVQIDDPVFQRAAYLPGSLIHEQVVVDWGLRIGEPGEDDNPEAPAQVRSLRPQELARPAANAGRDEWLRYRQSQPGADHAALEDMGRNALRDMDAAPESTADERDDHQPAEPGDTKEG